MVILDRSDWLVWLELTRPESELLRPLPAGSLMVEQVRICCGAIGSVADCIRLAGMDAAATNAARAQEAPERTGMAAGDQNSTAIACMRASIAARFAF